MKKRLLALLLCASMLLPLSACGDEGSTNKEVKQPSVTKLEDYTQVSGILEKVAAENADNYFYELLFNAGIGIVEVKDRDVVQAGDIVSTDYTGYVNDKPFKNGSTITDGKSNPQYIDVDNNCGVNITTGASSGGFIDGFSKGLIGAKKNEDKSAPVTFPKGYGETTLVDGDNDSSNDVKVSLSEKEATFVFNVKAIYQRITPENLTDALVEEKFFKEYGVKTVEEFMKVVKEEAEKAAFETYFSNVIYNAGLSTVVVKDRDVVQKGDLVKIDYTGYYEGVAFKAGSAINQWVDVDGNCVIDLSTGYLKETFKADIASGLVGMKLNETKDHVVTMPNNYGETTLLDDDKDGSNDVKVDLSNKNVTYKLTVKEIRIVVTPETITDEIVKENFAKSYKVETVEEFLVALKEELAYSNIINYLINNGTFDIPESYLSYRVDKYQELFQELYCGNNDINSVLSTYYGTTLANARLQWAASLKSQITTELIFAEIAKRQSLEVDDAERDAYIKMIIDSVSEEDGNDFLKKEENIFRMIGAGDQEAGKAYVENQNSVKVYFTGLYKELEK